MPYLPDRPYRLKRNHASKMVLNAALGLAVMLALGTLMIAYGVAGMREGLANAAVWHRGEVAQGAQVDGQVETHSAFGLVDLFHEYELRVTFRDASGVERRAEQEVMSFLEKADTDREPVVRYDPADPERVAVSWTAQMAWGPVLWLSWMLFVGPLVALGGIVLFRTARRTVRSAQGCATQGREVEFKVLSLTKLGGLAAAARKHRMVYEVPAQGARRARKREIVLDGPPLLVGPPGAQRAVGLVSPAEPDHPTFPLADLHPYEATAEQRAALDAAFAGGAT